MAGHQRRRDRDAPLRRQVKARNRQAERARRLAEAEDASARAWVAASAFQGALKRAPRELSEQAATEAERALWNLTARLEGGEWP